jgi:LmbE family N-acetylglucosaminyl deacetylase
MRILIIAAHPDDEVLGCGGTMAKLSAQNEIYSLILGEGITSRDESERQKNDELKSLNENMLAANKILGIRQVFTENLPDNKFDTVPLLTIIKIIERYIAKIKPEIVYTHHKGDLNIDHRITFDAVLTACRPIENPVKKILSFEIPSSTEWNSYSMINSFNPTVFEDISLSIDIKLDAMSKYENEIRLNPHPRSIEKIKALAEIRGASAGMNFAEAFMLIRELRQ